MNYGYVSKSQDADLWTSRYGRVHVDNKRTTSLQSFARLAYPFSVSSLNSGPIFSPRAILCSHPSLSSSVIDLDSLRFHLYGPNRMVSSGGSARARSIACSKESSIRIMAPVCLKICEPRRNRHQTIFLLPISQRQTMLHTSDFVCPHLIAGACFRFS